MHPANPNEQYEAVIYTAKGVYTMDYFGNAEQAKKWISGF
jgi:hypothetical protein